MDTDRNLLFAVLALQLDFVSREQFVDACSLWATKKTTPIADVFATLGLLDADARAEVERAVARKLKKHQGDVHASLADAANDDDVRSALTRLPDADIQRSLTPSDIQVHPTVLPETTPDGPRYVTLRLHAKGGIGQVWVARDDSMGRQVALKDLRPDRCDPGYWSRFLREAQITGQLEHPGIVPIYEVGRKPGDNQPFYTMRLIKGETMQAAVAAYHERRKRGAAGPLELRELLSAFVALCNATAYAHSRGVLHRDLKPQNVILGDYGEVLLIDWGLAKLMSELPAPTEDGTVPPRVALDAPPEETPAGQVMGTPAYMAPEQATGRLDLLDVRTDVYGLGGILYHLLTGRAPFTGTMQHVLAQVESTPPTPPRAVVPSVPSALAAICLKALAKPREERYPHAKALADDVLHYLADEETSAYRDPLSVKVARWGRRHRTAVATTAALLLTATLALAVGLFVVNAEKNRTLLAEKATRDALEDVTAAQAQTKAALAAETKALARSQAAEKNATTQRQLALKTVRNVVDDIHERLKDRPGHKELRKALLNRALAGLKEVAREADTATTIDHETIWALFERGDIFLEIEEGGLQEAKAQYQRAFELAERLAKADPTSAQAQRDLSISHNKIGDVVLEQGDSKGALESYRKGLEVSERLAKADPTSAQAQRDLSVSYNNLGTVQLRLGDSKGALESYRKTHEILERLAKADPTSAQAQRDLLVSHYKLGNVAQQTGAFDDAVPHYEEALAVARRFAKPDVFAREMEFVEGCRVFCQSVVLTLTDLSAASRLPPTLRVSVLQAAIPALARRKDAAKTAAAADLLASLVTQPGEVYDASCGHALAAALHDKAEDKERSCRRAVALLRQAVHAGFRNVAHIKKDTDLTALRDRADFKDLLHDLEAPREKLPPPKSP